MSSWDLNPGGGSGGGISLVQNTDGTLSVVGGSGPTATLSRAAITGDVSVPAASDTAALAAIGSATGPLGSATAAPIVTIDAKGRVTALSSATINPQIPSGILASRPAAAASLQPYMATDDFGGMLYLDEASGWQQVAKHGLLQDQLYTAGNLNFPAATGLISSLLNITWTPSSSRPIVWKLLFQLASSNAADVSFQVLVEMVGPPTSTVYQACNFYTHPVTGTDDVTCYMEVVVPAGTFAVGTAATLQLNGRYFGSPAGTISMVSTGIRPIVHSIWEG